MSILSRGTLIEIFSNGSTPSGSDFKNLIESSLNRRDDHFFGQWQPSLSYRNGDVVIYNKSLYILVMDVGEICGENNGNGQGQGSNSYCGKEAPDVDKNWCLMELDITDDDWLVIPLSDSSESKIMLSKVFGGIGIGFDLPEENEGPPEIGGALVIQEKDMTGETVTGKYIFSPETDDPVNANPTFEIQNLTVGEDPVHFKQIVEDARINLDTNAAGGFVFTKGGQVLQVINSLVPEGTEEASMNIQSQPEKTEPVETEPVDILKITTDHYNNPAVGIGALSPQGMLDVDDGDNAQVLIMQPEKPTPELVLVNRMASNGTSYLGISQEHDHTAIVSNAQHGLRIGSGHDLATFKKGRVSQETWMAFDQNGRVGIGTENPGAKLEVTDNKSGTFKLNLSEAGNKALVNPSFSITNLRQQHNYLTLGVDNTQSIFISDKPYVFRMGESGTTEGNAENIDQDNSTDLLSIYPEGKVGIGITPTQDYELDLYGKLRSFGLYLDTDKKKISKTGDLEDVMEKVMQLSPIKFKWESGVTNCANEGEQVGFFAYQLADHFPQVVKLNPDQTKSVAYQNMVAILVKAVQEQQDEINALKLRVESLEGNESTAA